MISTDTFDTKVKKYEQWYEEHPGVYESEVLALKEQLLTLPAKLRGIEVGLGTGRFSVRLGIKEGIEPSREMAKRAMKRGIEIMEGKAERLPYADMQFDFVLFVTICHLMDVKKAVEEAARVLKPSGALIIGFLDSDKAVAKSYIARKQSSHFYRNARFFTVGHLEKLLKKAGFKKFQYNQTLFGSLEDIEQTQQPKPGYGLGSFVTVKATKE